MTIRVAEGRSIVTGEQFNCLTVATESHHHDRGIQAQCIQCEPQAGRLDQQSQLYSGLQSRAGSIPPIWFGLAFLRTRLPCSDPTTDDKNSRVELAVGT